jgi:2-polyprenyl-3-methyl-5-hydroxy-6-metoxy-1,4-benzoquinol methylase
LKWVVGNEQQRQTIENTYRGVHEWTPERRGDCYTEKFNFEHPETITRDLSLLRERFEGEVKIIFNEIEKQWENKMVSNSQLNLNKSQLNNNYPPHWINLLKSLKSVDNIESIIFHDAPCGVGSTFKLLKDNDYNFLYKGYDMSKHMIETAKNEWNYENFYICDIKEVKIRGDNDLIYVDGLLDMLHNSAEVFEHILSLRSKYVIINRVRLSEKKKIETYIAYDLIKVVEYTYEYSEFINIINKNNYSIKAKIDNLFLIELL